MGYVRGLALTVRITPSSKLENHTSYFRITHIWSPLFRKLEASTYREALLALTTRCGLPSIGVVNVKL